MGRIMRKDNYLIAMINKGVLAPYLPLPRFVWGCGGGGGREGARGAGWSGGFSTGTIQAATQICGVWGRGIEKKRHVAGAVPATTGGGSGGGEGEGEGAGRWSIGAEPQTPAPRAEPQPHALTPNTAFRALTPRADP